MKTLLTICLLMIAGQVEGTKHYVKDTTGNDDGTSWADAWPNMTYVDHRAGNIAQGCTVYVNGHHYNVELNPLETSTGSPTDYTYFTSGNGTDDTWTRGDGVLNGGDVIVATWNSSGSNKYHAANPLGNEIKGVQLNDSTLLYDADEPGVDSTDVTTFWMVAGTDSIGVHLPDGSDPTGDSIYLWDHEDPGGSASWILNYSNSGDSAHDPGDGYHVYAGLTFRGAGNIAYIVSAYNCDSVRFDSCKLFGVSDEKNLNTAPIYVGNHGNTVASYPHGWVFEACSIGYSITTESASKHGSGFQLYHTSGWQIENNDFYGPIYWMAIYYKGASAGITNLSPGDTIINNRFNMDCGQGAVSNFKSHHSKVVVVGNYIKIPDTAYNPPWGGGHPFTAFSHNGCCVSSADAPSQLNEIKHNSVWGPISSQAGYDVYFYQSHMDYAANDTIGTGNVIKYNLYVVESGSNNIWYSYIRRWPDRVGIYFDSNLFYNGDANPFRAYDSAGSTPNDWAWATWRDSLTFDSNSVFTDPGLVDPANDDWIPANLTRWATPHIIQNDTFWNYGAANASAGGGTSATGTTNASGKVTIE